MAIYNKFKSLNLVRKEQLYNEKKALHMAKLWEEENKKYSDKPQLISLDDRNKKFQRMEKVNYGEAK